MENSSKIIKHTSLNDWLKLIFCSVIKPALFIVSIYGIYITGVLFAPVIGQFISEENFRAIIYSILQILVIGGIYWFFVRLINDIYSKIQEKIDLTNKNIGRIVAPLIGNSLKVIILLSLINLIVPYLALPPQYSLLVEKVANIILIGAISWIILQVINASEDFVLNYYGDNVGKTDAARTVYTQVHILKKIAIGLLIILTLGAMLMLFQNVRELGTSILASAGIASLAVGFAAQKSLANIIIGLQIAINQPVRINDMVVVENEMGTVEEITLNYVIVKIWDLRRLVIPINYFIEKPFQNWSRQSTEQLAPIFIYADYTLPVEKIREEFLSLLKESKLWDGKVGVLHVSNIKETTMELRALMSVKSPGDAWELGCQMREKLVAYIRENYPDSLPHARQQRLK